MTNHIEDTTAEQESWEQWAEEQADWQEAKEARRDETDRINGKVA